MAESIENVHCNSYWLLQVEEMHQSVKNNVIDQLELTEKKKKPSINKYIFYVISFTNLLSENSTIFLPLNVTATLSMTTAFLELDNSTSTIKGIQMLHV